MQIAMAAPDAAFHRAGCKPRRRSLQRFLKACGQGRNFGLGQARRAGGAQIAFQHGSHGGGRIQPFNHGCRLVQGKDRIAQSVQKPAIQRTARRHRIQKIAGRNRRHAEHPFHRLPHPALLQTSIRGAGDGHHIAVNPGRGGLVQLQFPPAEMRPRCQGAEIKKSQRDGLLHLPGGLPPHKNRRDMGLNRCGAGKLLQKRGHFRLALGNAGGRLHG